MCAAPQGPASPKAQPQLAGAPSVTLMDGLSPGDLQLGSVPCCLWDSCLIHHQGLLAGWAGQLHECPARAFRGCQVGLSSPAREGGCVASPHPASLNLRTLARHHLALPAMAERLLAAWLQEGVCSGSVQWAEPGAGRLPAAAPGDCTRDATSSLGPGSALQVQPHSVWALASRRLLTVLLLRPLRLRRAWTRKGTTCSCSLPACECCGHTEHVNAQVCVNPQAVSVSGTGPGVLPWPPFHHRAPQGWK